MYIPPNTEIHILKGVPLASDYENTVFYPDQSTQVQEFLRYKQFTLTNFSYQRANLDTIRVQLPYASLYDCNYLMFKNTSFENKWFFCFIENISYISNEVTAIYYKEDVMQTWCYDYHFMDSYVERRHSTHDRPMENIQPEGLEIGSFYKEVNSWIYRANEHYAFYLLSSDLNGVTVPNSLQHYYRGLINGVYNSLDLIVAKSSQISDLNTLIDNISKAGKDNAVVAFYIGPDSIFKTSEKQTFAFDYDKKTARRKFKNNKLYTSPYHMIQLTNNDGQTIVLNPEQMGDLGKFTFYISSAGFPNAQLVLQNSNYQGAGGFNAYNLVLVDYPINSYKSNSFQSWWAQNKNSYIQSLNSVDASYDANQQVAQNNYNLANRSAKASFDMSNNSTSATLSNAQMGVNTSQRNITMSRQFTKDADSAKGSIGVVGNLLNGQLGSAATSGLNAAQAESVNALAFGNQMNSLATDMANAENSAGASRANASIAYDNALRSNAVNKANNNLTNLTNKNNAINSLIAKKRDIMNTPNTAKLNASANTVNWFNGTLGFQIIECYISEQYLDIIDEYFTAYGYAQDRMFNGKDLNERINRKHYSYIRTVGCNIVGYLNNQDATTIRNIYDNGITTWDSLADVGNYSLDNDVKEGA